MSNLLNDTLDRIAATLTTHNAWGSELASHRYQRGIQTASDYVTGLMILDPEQTYAFLGIFGGDPEIALRVLRERIAPEVAQLLPDGVEGMTLHFDDVPGARKQLALYTTPLYDSWRS